GLTALSAEFTIGEGELMAHDVPLGCAPDEYDDLISGTCSHLPKDQEGQQTFIHFSLTIIIKFIYRNTNFLAVIFTTTAVSH
ncbi:hypothetical protein, partial [Citrobacter freundii]|uniref:hypothetical protein n=1 Tax=Citrobacter freundii TaxID=546 RepID=UPI0039C27CC5